MMKDSGIEWIGEIPETWDVTKLKYFISGYKAGPFGSALITDKLNPQGNLLVYTPEHIAKNTADLDGNLYLPDERFEEMQQFLVEAGDVIFPIVGSLGRSMLVTDDMPVGIINQRLAKFRVDTKRLSMSYFLWLFSKSTFFNTYIDLNCRGAIIVNLTKQIVCDIPIPHPVNIVEQHRIADFLDRKCAEIDAVIERTKATIEEYKKLKQAVITEAVTKGVRGPRPMKDSGIEWLGCIPDEWDCTKLKQVWISVDSGVSVNAADYPTDNDAQYGVLKTSCVSKFVFLPHEHKQVDADEYSRVACPVKKDTIIVSRMNTPDLVGACGYVDADYPNLFLPDRLWQISFHSEVIAKFVWYYLNNQMVRAYISSLSTGTSSSMQNISKPQFGGITLAVPSSEEQREIVSHLDEKCAALDTLIAKKTALLIELETYKKSLIYEYVTGKKEIL